MPESAGVAVALRVLAAAHAALASRYNAEAAVLVAWRSSSSGAASPAAAGSGAEGSPERGSMPEGAHAAAAAAQRQGGIKQPQQRQYKLIVMRCERGNLAAGWQGPADVADQPPPGTTAGGDAGAGT